MFSFLIQDKSQLSSSIRLEVTSKNTWGGQTFPKEKTDFLQNRHFIYNEFRIEKIGLENPYHPDNKMSVYTVNEDNLFFDEKTIVCPQKLNRIFQLRLMTLYFGVPFSWGHLLFTEANISEG